MAGAGSAETFVLTCIALLTGGRGYDSGRPPKIGVESVVGLSGKEWPSITYAGWTLKGEGGSGAEPTRYDKGSCWRGEYESEIQVSMDLNILLITYLEQGVRCLRTATCQEGEVFSEPCWKTC